MACLYLTFILFVITCSFTFIYNFTCALNPKHQQDGNNNKYNSKSSSKLQQLPPGPKGWPIVGNLPKLLFSKRGLHEVVNEWVKDFGNVMTFTIFGTRFVILSDLGVMQETFLSVDINDMSPIPACNKALGAPPEAGIGIITASEGPAWRDIRKFLISALRRMKLGANSFENLAVEEADKLIVNFSGTDGKPFNPASSINIAVANVMSRLVLGTTFAYDDKDFLRLTELADDVFESFGVGLIFSLVPELSYLRSADSRKGDSAITEMLDFITRSVEQRRADFDPLSQPQSMVESFLKEQHERSLKGDIGVFDDTNLVQFTWDLLISGWQSINTTILWYLIILAQHPDVQRRVQEELDEVVGRDRPPSIDGRASFPFVEATMAECYRVSRLLPIQIPHRSRCDVKVAGYDVPKGSYVASNTGYLCSSEDFWENPDDFRPKRFLDETGAFDRKLEARLAEFGVGRRACPGEQLSRTELFTFFVHIFHRFTIELPEGAPRTIQGRSGLTVNPLPFEIRAKARY